MSEAVNRDQNHDEAAGVVFVGAPINYARSDGGFDSDLKHLILRILSVLDESGLEVLSAHREEGFEPIEEELNSSHITARDFNWMARCEVFVAVLPEDREGNPFRSDGTHVELGWATGVGKPVVLVASSPLNESYSHLVRGMGALTRVTVLDCRTVADTPSVLKDAVSEFL